MDKKRKQKFIDLDISVEVLFIIQIHGLLQPGLYLRACHSSSLALSLFRCHCCYHRQFW